jgi:microcystin-dependent protein/cytoskeletal protein CcmA (bactofilin family)
MPYIVNFTDRENKVPITVFDNTSSTDTSLTFPGRNVTGYGQIIAENFLALLENFARTTPPINPTEGQLWYDSSEGVMKVWDNVQWKAASNIQKSPVEPAVESSRLGELWVDTTNQQLYIFSGTRWILVGPNFSTGLRSGPLVEQIDDSDGQARVILSFYVEDEPVFIISKDSFTPKISISGFTVIRTGLNITSLQIDNNDLETKLWGKAETADALNISGVEIPAGRFLRSDIINTTEFGINVRNNSGITIGTDGNFSLSSSATAAKIYNSTEGSSLDLQINRSGIPETILRIIDNNVGINVPDPDESLEVSGNILTDGNIIVTNSNIATNLTNGTIRTAGGVSIEKNLIVGDSIDISGTANLITTQPKITDTYELGTITKRWNTVRTKTLIADVIEGTLNGNIVGNASTSTNLRFETTFRMTGDVSAPDVRFDGQVGGLTKIFNTKLEANIITSKSFPNPNKSEPNDTILVFRSGTGLIKETRNVFIADLGVPIGAIMPYAGANVPEGYLLCDGSEVERVKFSQLFDIIGITYNGSAALAGVGTFRLPDLRGRFPLGRDNMDNGIQVPNSTGGFIDAGGGNVDRVPGTAADNLAGSGGQSSNTLIVNNLPDHEHNMRGSTGQQYFATRVDTAAPLDSGAFSDKGPTAVGQSQYLPSSGGVRTSGSLGQPFAVMNPYLTINYIIRSGPPAF